MRWLAVAMVACGSPPPPIAAHGEAPPAPACTVTRYGSGFGIAGTPIKIPLDVDEMFVPRIEATTFAHGAAHVLAAWRWDELGQLPFGSSDLYDVDCATGAVTAFAHVEHADFGHAASDGATLYFTALDGIRTLDLASKRSHVAIHPAPAQCPAPATPTTYDVVVALHADRLVFQRYDHCDYGPHYTTLVARSGGEPQPIERGALAIGAGHTIWATAMACDPPFVYRSDDHAEHWSLFGGPDVDGQAVVILPDKDHFDWAVVAIASCGDTALELYFNRGDSPVRWFRIVTPATPVAVTSRDGSIAALVMWEADGTAWLSDDTGVRWRKSAQPIARAARATQVLDGDWRYEAAPDGGVLTSHAGAPAELGHF